jgi:hypothetical protein
MTNPIRIPRELLAEVAPANRALVAAAMSSVCQTWGLTPEALAEPCRRKGPREARAVLAMLLRERGVTPAEIARGMGRQTGSAARYGARWAAGAVAKQPRLAALVQSLAAEIDAASADR